MIGREIRLDLIDVPREFVTNAERMAGVCANAAKQAGATVRKIAYEDLGEDSPPGITCAILLDESHVTAHSYADHGLLALNVFTCGDNADPFKLMQIIRLNVGGRPIFGPEVTERFIEKQRDPW